MYRITVAENSKPTGGKFVEVVGHYNPIAADQPLSVNKERVEYWLSQGVKPSNTVARLLNRVGFSLPVIQKQKSAKKLKEKLPAQRLQPGGKKVGTDSASKTETKKVEEIQESKELKEEKPTEGEPVKEKNVEKSPEKSEESPGDIDK